jgi:hypothetical protein
MSDKEIIVPAELTKLEVQCTKCQSASVFAFQKVPVQLREHGPVQCCPNCGQHFGSMLSALDNWNQLASTNSREDAPFRLKLHVPLSHT